MKKLPVILFILIIIGIVGWFTFLITQSNIQVLNPKGIIASGQRDLIFISYAIMFGVFFPVIGIALFTAWKYRSGNKKSTHHPDSSGSKSTLFMYGLFLAELMLVFFYIVYRSSHQLDPRRPITSDKTPITIQVVALDWKWLFIYPEENIATVNFIQVPVDTPVEFKLTADAPMNSFWIPQLGGQIYAMSGMETKINLMANEEGDYSGGAAEINGRGFAGMRFITRASSEDEFNSWVEQVKREGNPLTKENYEKLVVPSENTPVTYYSIVAQDLFSSVVTKYMMHGKSHMEGEGHGH